MDINLEYADFMILDNEFITYVNTVIKNVFIKLVNFEYECLCKYVIIIIDTLAYKFNFSKSNINLFYQQLSQNNNQDIIAITYLLLPYIDDKNSYELFSEIKKLADITCKKKKNIDLSDKSINPYLISNYQYTRYINNSNKDDNILKKYQPLNEINDYIEYVYTLIDLSISFKLVLETIEQINTKLYINWINIVPLTIQDYKTDEKYINSFYYNKDKKQFVFKHMNNEEQFLFWNLEIDSALRIYNGISAKELFNTIYVYLYLDIYKQGVKWLIYEKQLNKNEQPTTYLELINKFIDIKYLYNNYLFEDIIDKKKIITQFNIILDDVVTLTNSMYFEFIKCLIFKFDNTYCDKNIKEKYNYDYISYYKKLYKKDTSDDDKEDEDFFLDVNIGNREDFIEKINDFRAKIPMEEIYNFLVNTINIFKSTWYGKQILNYDFKTKILTINRQYNFTEESKILKTKDNTYYLTYKNIYNFAKYLSIDFFNGTALDKRLKEDYAVPKIVDARSLDEADQMYFFSLLNGGENEKFNIKNVLIKTYNEIPNKDYELFKNKIAETIRDNLKDLIFETLIQFGFLNKFVTDISLTDNRELGKDESSRKKNIKKRLENKYKKVKDKYLDTYYYLTNDKYRNLEIYNKKNKAIDFFELTFEENEPWYYSYAMNWVSQINFFHHFINNRVILVTGATGQGKSTEVPKLLYYALRAINLNNRAKVISTQPTIQPTRKNAEIIAQNLGVPIKINNMPTFNGYLQYSTQDDKHLVKGIETFIKEVTDRTLYEELLKNPYLKATKNTEGKKVEFADSDYLDENIYDVVIIDEAHMHNINMDLILTLMKHVLFINNQIKLVITSATMDDDEYIYRRYYKMLDDNYGFPMTKNKKYYLETLGIKEFVDSKDDKINEDEQRGIILDKIVVDRRYHISPPGQTTKYTVTDIYENIEPENYEEAELNGLKSLDNIISKNRVGDILFFTTTTPAVNNLVEIINKRTPPYAIALPLYSKLKDKKGDWFDIVANINLNLKNIVYSKNDILGVIDNGPENYNKIPEGMYTMAIIVATNVVEASVTIPSLKFVIDTGYYNSVTFDADIDSAAQGIEKIPETSRLQRRGRVGRVASGTVYYTYKKNSRLNIKPTYGIVISDVTFDIYLLIHNFNQNDIPLLDYKHHPCNFNYNNSFGDYTVKDYQEFISNEKNILVKKIYDKQYNFSGDVTCRYINDFKLNESIISPLYKTGLDLISIFDYKGEYYIVHPSETDFKRNIVTGAILYNIKDDRYDDIYKSKKLINAFNKLQHIKYVYTDIKLNSNNINKNTIQYVHKFTHNILIDKLLLEENETFGFLLNKFASDDINRLVKILCISFAYRCEDKVAKILALIYTMDSYSNLILNINNKSKTKDFLKLWKNLHNSELFQYLKIMDFFIAEKNQIDKKTDFKINIINKKFENFIKVKNKLYTKILLPKYKDELTNETLELEEVIEFIKYDNLKLSENRRKDQYEKFKKSKVIDNSESIDEYCLKFFINSFVIKKALKFYNNIVKIIQREKNKDIFEWFKKNYPVILTTEDDNIIKCFLEMSLQNICIYDDKLYFKDDSYNKFLINIMSDNDKFINLPNICLIKITVAPLFYFIKDDKNELFGVTVINSKLINDVIHSKILNISSNYKKYIRYNEDQIINTSYKYVMDKSEYSMNKYIYSAIKNMEGGSYKKYKLVKK